MPITFPSKAVPPAIGDDTIWIIDFDVTNTIREVGLFNASSSGIMLIRRVLNDNITMVASNWYLIEIEYTVRDL